MSMSMSMSVSRSRIVTLAVTLLVIGAAATASAAPRKSAAERTTTSTTMCEDGTPIIMQGMECPRRPARGEQQEPEQKQPTQRAERPRVPRGSSGRYIPSSQPTPSLTLTQPPAGPYIPPPVANPSAQINQLNHSFPLNRGLGNNPTDRDSYIRYNLNR
jgi:hypothetical protein